METIDDPGLQAYFERTRGAAGIRLVGLREARRELLDALRDGIPVGLVGDRDLTGGGIADPAVRGARRCCRWVRRCSPSRAGVPVYVRGRAARGPRPLPRRARSRSTVPAEGTRRERVTATMTRLAAAFEDLIADAPEQWWAVFFPIWPDLEAPAADVAAPPAEAAA